MNALDRISLDPAIRSGKPCIKETRITIHDILEYLAGGMTEEQILFDFPSLQRQDIQAARSLAATLECGLHN